MTTEAIRTIDRYLTDKRVNGREFHDAVRELRVALAASEAARERAERERDRLIEAWPSVGELGVWQMLDGRWAIRDRIDGGHATRSDAIRTAAALDAPATWEVGG
jgi:hypothetical protein